MPYLTEEDVEKYKDAKIQEFDTKIKGLTFAIDNEPDLMSYLQDGDAVVFQAELDNPYDAHAVAVIHNQTEKKLGHIRKEIAQEIWENIVKHGNLYAARITITGGTEGKNYGLNLDVRRCYFE